MTSKLKYHKDYTELGETYQLVLPLSLEGLVSDRVSADACEDLFYRLVKRLESAGKLSRETVFIDGIKLEAAANKYTHTVFLCIERSQCTGSPKDLPIPGMDM